MKRIDEQKVWTKEILERDHRLAVMAIIRQQIDIVGELMERNQGLVKSPLSYNMVAGLLDQLKTHAIGAFTENGGAAPSNPDGVPITDIGTKDDNYFQFPHKDLGL